MKQPDPSKYVCWLLSRSAGVVALILVSASVMLGLAMASKLIRSRGITPLLAKLHERTAVAGLGAMAVHGVALLGDKWLNPGVQGIAVPFAMSFRPLYTGLGIIAAYLAALLGLSFYLRRRIGPRLWRKAHRATVVVWALAAVHTLGAGTDARSLWLRAIVFAPAPPLAGLFAYRTLLGTRRPAIAREQRPRAAAMLGTEEAA